MSRGNVVDPIDVINKNGTDALRFYLMFVSSPDKALEWSDEGIEVANKFLKRFLNLYKKKIGEKNEKLLHKVHKTIRDISDDIENFRYNLALIKIISYIDFLNKSETITKESIEISCKLLSPFCPHISEELWHKLKHENFLSLEKWPKFNTKYINDAIEYEEEFIENVKKDIQNVYNIIKKEGQVTLFVAHKWKYDFIKKLKETIKKTRNMNEIISKVKIPEHMKEISSIVAVVLKDESKMPKIILSQEKEFNILKEAGFNVIKAENSKEEKALKSLPGKPAIIVK
mgnify:FL=1